MRMKMKRWFGVLLSLALTLSLLPGMNLTAYAEDTENTPTLGDSSLSGTKWNWDAATKTLTLSGVNWSGTLVMPAASNLVLTGGTKNTVTGSGTTEVYYGSSLMGHTCTGLYGKGVLTISGGGELYVYSSSDLNTQTSNRQRGICVNGNLTISSDVGTVYAKAGNSNFSTSNASNYCDIYAATVGISVHGNYIQYGGNVEGVAGTGGYQSIGITVGRGAAGVTVDGASAVLTGRGGAATNHSFGMCCGSEFDNTKCSIHIKKGKVNLYGAENSSNMRFNYGLFGGNGCVLYVSGGEIAAIGSAARDGSRGLRSRGGINISGGVLNVEGVTSALYAGSGGIKGDISITGGMLVAKTGNSIAVQADNGKITLAAGLTTQNVKNGFTSGSSNKIYAQDTNLPVRVGSLKYYVQFDVQNHGSSPATQYFDMTESSKVERPDDPVAAGYDFGGWYEDAECTTEWNFETIVTNDIVLYAKWTLTPPISVYFIKQNTDGSWPESADGSEFVTYPGSNTSYTVPAEEKYPHYTACAWSTAYQAAESARSATYPGSNIKFDKGTKELYIYYALEQINLNFYEDLDGEKLLKTEKAYYGESLSKYLPQTEPAQEGYSFEGWAAVKPQEDNVYGGTEYVYKEIYGGTEGDVTLTAKKLDFDSATADGAAIYPMFIRDRLRVELNLAGGTMAEGQATEFTTDLGERIAMNGEFNSLNPGQGMNQATKAGYTLFGWVTQKDGTVWDPSWGTGKDHADNDTTQYDSAKHFKYYTMTLTALWTPAGSTEPYTPYTDGQFTITYHLNGGDGSVPEYTVSSNDAVTLPANMTKEGYTFAGWHTGSDVKLNPDEQGKIPAPGEDLELYAIWSATELKITEITAESRSITTNPGALITAAMLGVPANPDDQKVFGGWNNESGPQAVPFYMGASDITLTANWLTKEAKPAAPTATTTATAITVTAPLDSGSADYEYSIDGGNNWTDETTFAQLTPGTAYELIARQKPVDGTKVTSDPSPAAEITTLKTDQVPPSAPGIAATEDRTVVVAPAMDGEEYVIVPKDTAPDDIDWTQAKSPEDGKVVLDGLTPKTEYDIYARMKETAWQNPSHPSDPTAVKTRPTAPANAESAGFVPDYITETYTIGEGYEVSASRMDHLASLTEAIDGSGKVYIRVKATDDTQASDWLEVTLPTRPAAPEDLTAENASNNDTADGKIKGTTASMEYSADNGETWTDAGETDTLTKPGVYLVRVKATDSAPHGETAEVTVESRPIDTPADNTITVPVSGEDETVNVKVEVKDDTATVKESEIDKVLEAEQVGTVTVDVSVLEENVSEVVIPNAMLKKVADALADEESTADGLKVKLPAGSVTFDADAVATITEQADGKDLTLHLHDVKVTELTTAQQEAIRDLEIEVVLDAYLTSGGKRISDFHGVSATVKVPYELKEGQNARGLVVWYVATDGTRSQVPASYDGKNVVFTVPHFSNYVIAYDAEKAAACPKDDTCPISVFDDAEPTAWYHDGVHWALENGVMKGTGNTTFAPNVATSRAMIVTMLYRMEGEPNSDYAMTFRDVSEGQWYTEAIRWAAENKIVEGYSADGFGPDDALTREQLGAILYRYGTYKGLASEPDANILDYTDASEISAWAMEAFRWNVQEGIITGVGAGKLSPRTDASRAQVATMLMRYTALG